jgi:diguanylate cyclase (GGDEF)-like protein
LPTHYHALVTKGFDTPAGFDRLGRDTWSYYVMTKGGEPLYLDGAAGRETGMPLLCSGEPFPPEGRIAYLFPLRGTDEPFGVVGLVGKDSCPFGAEDREAAGFLLGQAGALVELALLNRLHAEMALKDALTGLFNRRHFDEQLRLELRRAQREGAPVGLLLCDLDHFKRVNDTYGHPAGDAVLREAARRITEAVRDVDIVCRYGGEEFAVVLPACLLEEACQVAERVRSAMCALPVPLDGATALPVSVSVGVSAFPSPVNNALELARAADAALYRAKTRGRNRVESGGA